jgi:CubicO group peptidase (beta-lactamase class C family)
LQFQDDVVFGSRSGLGVVLSPRDMARVGLLWLNEGRWEGKKLIHHRLFTKNVRTQVPPRLPRSAGAGHDHLGVGTYGGGTDQTPFGPGVYGLGFWFNEKLPSGTRVWPAATRDAFQANGAWNRDTVTVFPSLKMIVVVSRSRHGGTFRPGTTDGPAAESMKLLMDAVLTGRPKKG